ncbi:KPN_02809 family neutral zinc metallopeptidase [Sulfurovum sp. NBC37-1]|uniref:KPN_02809 family neutral zinc metallopeptidase n=1 Tax=Sulfurovum sp. (strain NBC37-1) TaxID=387093 RepID=UPI0001587A15|nr:neutral zinc metallopeptidase [Sulfurovum sp. NBC37-1]BAF72986.1 zinc metallopeptidase [Sulfurovum sp. NBC37-1]
MRMDDEQESRNVDDRRASTGRGGRMDMRTMLMLWPLIRPLLRSKLGLLIIGVGVAAYLMGYNPLALVGIGGHSAQPVNKAEDEKRAVFIKKVLKSTEDVWSQILPKYGLRYTEPVMVLYRGYTQSGCGGAQSQMGPFYCPRDKKVYLDLGFFDELAKRHNAPGDFAQAYVLAHEIGHHVQDLQGTLDKVQRMKQSWGGNSKKANALQVRVELQADCYAGIWGHYAQKKFHMLEPGDIDEALNAASAIGDDRLQREATGRVRPDAFTHGSSKQRVEWFKRGFESGDLRQCDTFR